jgi:hypothetical protein
LPGEELHAAVASMGDLSRSLIALAVRSTASRKTEAGTISPAAVLRDARDSALLRTRFD